MKIRLLSVFSAALLFRAYVLNSLFPVSFGQEPLFIADLLGLSLVMPFWLIMLFGLGNLGLIWLIGKYLFNNQIAFAAALFYTISPWVIYQEIAGSVYIFLLFGLLLAFGGLLMTLRNFRAGYPIMALSVTALLSTSLMMWLVLPILLLGLKSSKLVKLKLRKNILINLLIFMPLFFLITQNPAAVTNVTKQQIKIFSNLSLLNSVNAFRGEDIQSPYAKLGQLIDNRYIYFVEHLTIILTKHLNPVTYFTPDDKLLGFSAHPPIFLGLIIPFLGGLSLLKILWQKYRYSSLTLVSLLIPSLLSLQGFDINKLVLVSPLILFIVGYGWSLVSFGTSRIILKLLVIILVLTQLLVMLADLPNRERERYQPISAKLTKL